MSVTVGSRWVSPEIEMEVDQMQTFSHVMGDVTGYGVREGQVSYHDDPDHARALGYRAAVAWGLQTYGVASCAVEALLGEEGWSAQEFDMRFTRPVFAGERVRTVLELTSSGRRSDGRYRYLLDVWCERGDGSKVAEGRVVAGDEQ